MVGDNRVNVSQQSNTDYCQQNHAFKRSPNFIILAKSCWSYLKPLKQATVLFQTFNINEKNEYEQVEHSCIH